MRNMLCLMALLAIGGCSVVDLGPSIEKDDPKDWTYEYAVAELCFIDGENGPPSPDVKPDGKRRKCDQCVNGKVGDGRTMVDCQKCGGDGWIDPQDQTSEVGDAPAEDTRSELDRKIDERIESKTNILASEISKLQQALQEPVVVEVEPQPIPDPWLNVPQEVIDSIANSVKEKMAAKPTATAQAAPAKPKRTIVMHTMASCTVCTQWKNEVKARAERELGYVVTETTETNPGVFVPWFEVCNEVMCCKIQGFMPFTQLEGLTKSPGKSVLGSVGSIATKPYVARWPYQGNLAAHLKAKFGATVDPGLGREDLERFHDLLCDGEVRYRQSVAEFNSKNPGRNLK